jgi:hypothetical protein
MRDGETVASIQMRAEQDRVMLIYRYRSGDAEWKDEQYPVRIVRTPCNLGGSRAWFICPVVGCGRRVAILCGGSIFACRHCYRLVYASSREDAGDRATRRADRLRARLDWEPGILNGGGEKPKWAPHSGKPLNPPNFSIIACMERPTKASCFAASRWNVRQRGKSTRSGRLRKGWRPAS